MILIAACDTPEGDDYWECVEWYESVFECDNCAALLHNEECDAVHQYRDDWAAWADWREADAPECE